MAHHEPILRQLGATPKSEVFGCILHGARAYRLGVRGQESVAGSWELVVVRTYKELVAWQKGMALVKAIYALVKQFPKIEQYRLVDQLTRAAVSVPSNIAEGFGRATNKDFAHFLSQARGSLFEVETQLLIAKDLGFVGDVEPELELSSELGRILNGLIRKLSSIPPAP